MSGEDAGKVRQAFEAQEGHHWVDAKFSLRRGPNGHYQIDAVQKRWEGFELGAAFAQGSQAAPRLREAMQTVKDSHTRGLSSGTGKITVCNCDTCRIFAEALEAAAQSERPGPTPIFPPRVEYAHRVECPERHPVLIGEGRCTCESAAPQSAPGPLAWNGPHPWNVHWCPEVEGSHLPIENVCKGVMPSEENASKPRPFYDRNRISATAGDASAQTRSSSVAPPEAERQPTSSSTSASLTRPVSSDVAPDREETGAVTLAERTQQEEK
jgi:hypothetical protein